MRAHFLADACWAAALASLPLVGVGVGALITGRDLGAGFQPSYLLAAAAWLCRLVADAGGTYRTVRDGWSIPGARLVWLILAAGLAALLISGLGLHLAPAPVMGHEAGPRFLKQLIQVLIMVAFALYAWLWTRGERRWRITTLSLAVGLVMQLAYAPLQGWFASGPGAWLAPIDHLATSNPAILSGSSWLYLGEYLAVPRLRGTMCEPLYLGSYLLMVLPLMLVARRRWLALAGLVLLGATWSRGAWLAAGIAAVAWMVLGRRAGLESVSRRWWWGLGGALVATCLVVALVAGADSLLLPWRRVLQTLDGSDWSNLTRYHSLKAAWRAFLISPVVGVGWGQFAYHFYAQVDLSGLQSQFTWPVVNSVPLLVLCETGLLGLTVLLATLGLAWRTTWRSLRTAAPDGARRVAMSAAAVGVGAQLLVFSQYNLPHLWVLAGLWLAAHIPAGVVPSAEEDA